jgi:hypothetical protein
MAIKLGVKITPAQFDKVATSLDSALTEGEEILFMGITSNLKPFFRFLFITNERIIGLAHPDKDVIKRELPHSKINGIRLGTGITDNKCLLVESVDAQHYNFGAIKSEDSDSILGLLQEMQGKQSNPDFETLREGKIKLAVRNQSEIPIIGRRPNEKSMKVIFEHCNFDELPNFIICTGLGTGVFVAFSDRCMIIKVGAVTSFMAGSLFGGRVSTFPYSEITGIEYNSGLVNGVLEVLTASYEGSKNKDYWRGTLKSRNGDSNDPWTLSNCLPLDRATYGQAQDNLNELRKLIADSKKPSVVINNAGSSTSSIADQLKELGKLRDQGILSEDEFIAAKNRVITGA